MLVSGFSTLTSGRHLMTVHLQEPGGGRMQRVQQCKRPMRDQVTKHPSKNNFRTMRTAPRLCVSIVGTVMHGSNGSFAQRSQGFGHHLQRLPRKSLL